MNDINEWFSAKDIRFMEKMVLLLLSTHSSLIIGGSPLLLSDGGSPPASPASPLAGLLRRRDPSTNPGPTAQDLWRDMNAFNRSLNRF